MSRIGGLSISAGDVLLKKYRVEKLIGEGGTGIVVSATHLQLEQRVAIKFLRSALDSDELRTRFEREARAMGQIESEHVVLVLDAGALDDGSPYMVMEHLEGRDLARVLKEDGPLPVEQAVDCMLQVCEALSHAHDNGIVHRDLKPANLFLTEQPDQRVHVKVVDFGISKILDKKLLEKDGAQAHEVTSAFTMLGSPRYMAPEQVRNSKDVDGRADLWSVGAVLFQLISGKHAFDAEGNVQASVAVLSADPQSLAAVATQPIPPGLEEVVRKCLTRDVAKRFQTARELADALRPFASAQTKESLDRIQSAEREPGLGVPLISPRSRPPPDPAVLPSGNRHAPTERKIRVDVPAPAPIRRGITAKSDRHILIDPSAVPAMAGPISAPVPSSGVPVSSSAPAGRPSSTTPLVLTALGVFAFVLIFGGIVAVKRFSSHAASARWEPVSASQPATLPSGSNPAKPATMAVPLDAGRASP